MSETTNRPIEFPAFWCTRRKRRGRTGIGQAKLSGEGGIPGMAKQGIGVAVVTAEKLATQNFEWQWLRK